MITVMRQIQAAAQPKLFFPLFDAALCILIRGGRGVGFSFIELWSNAESIPSRLLVRVDEDAKFLVKAQRENPIGRAGCHRKLP